ncbi:hypothetical protein GQX74_004067 [Glossina fuscipes]|nr:hypothetical protein GQX74_004067 [Glossina fuscipes]
MEPAIHFDLLRGTFKYAQTHNTLINALLIFQYPLSELTTRSIRCKDSGTCNDASVVKRKLKNIAKPITITKANVNSHHRRYANTRAEDNADALLTSSSYSNNNNLNINAKDEAYITVTANGFSKKSD